MDARAACEGRARAAPDGTPSDHVARVRSSARAHVMDMHVMDIHVMDMHVMDNTHLCATREEEERDDMEERGDENVRRGLGSAHGTVGRVAAVRGGEVGGVQSAQSVPIEQEQ